MYYGDDLIKGEWKMCKSFESGIETNLNHCLEISFNDNSQGNVESLSNFKWETNDSIITFSFISSKDKSAFISGDSVFTFKRYQEKDVQWLKMTSQNSKCWFLLGRIK